MDIRAEKTEDFAAIRQVNVAAFGRVNEADLVDNLRKASQFFSFVAVEDGQVVGHIFFSPVSVDGDCTLTSPILGLAPLAVLPNYQKRLIGSSLVQYSVKEIEGLGFSAVVVLGHPEYYPRFGFVPAKQKGLTCEYPVPDDVFMVLEMQSGALQSCTGTVKYSPEFIHL
ncbi:MAG: N-acetyltransferase [Scytonematopsis contorta HA4267-MV1]|jgi:putative acetyltransferase|nr:N-acetyltransferase [Scytonematopsis contorta HA4267-MV1]